MFDAQKLDPKTELAPNLVDLLRWVGERPRTYGETMEAWRTSCPKLPAWEDAIDHEMVRVDSSGAATYLQAAVQLTSRGKRVLRAATLLHGSICSGSKTTVEQFASLSFSQIMRLMQKDHVRSGVLPEPATHA